jgi:cyclomaltodextrinase
MAIQTPDWVKNAVFYQIFPDRFARTHRHLDDPAMAVPLEPWETPPTLEGYKGGDLWGVMENLDYLVDLGVTAVYFTPIFQSASNHRYHTHDYYRVDPLLGGDQAFADLLEAAHQKGLKVVLDGVFNHCGRGSFSSTTFWKTVPILPGLTGLRSRTGPLRPTMELYLQTTRAGSITGLCRNSTTITRRCGNTSCGSGNTG